MKRSVKVTNSSSIVLASLFKLQMVSRSCNFYHDAVDHFRQQVNISSGGANLIFLRTHDVISQGGEVNCAPVIVTQ